MKKIFTLTAAILAALTLSAQTGFDGRDGTLGTQIHDNNLIADQNNITMNETDATAHKYEIKITTGGECSFTMGGITFWYSNSNDGTVAYKTYGTYIQPNGNKRKVTIPVVAGKTIKVYVQDAVTVGLENASAETMDLVAWGENKDIANVITPAAGATEVIMWSDKRDADFTAGKFKLGAVVYDGGTALDEVEAAGQVQKFIENGKLMIMKNGVKYNAAGVIVK